MTSSSVWTWIRRSITFQLLLCLVVCRTVTGGASEEGRACPGRKVFRGQCHIIVHEPATWQEADLDCRLMGGHLVDVADKDEMKHVQKVIQDIGSKSSYVWIGLNDLNVEGEYVWNDASEQVVYTNWQRKQPNNYRNQDCVGVRVSDGTWYDFACSEERPYICEVPTPDAEEIRRLQLDILENRLAMLSCGNTGLSYYCGTDCENDRLGTDYEGHVSVTRTGRTCQAWSAQSPHKQNYYNYFPEGSLEKAKNYCRNPSKFEGGLWCYTTDPKKRWETCDVPKCSKVLQLETTVIIEGSGESLQPDPIDESKQRLLKKLTETACKGQKVAYSCWKKSDCQSDRLGKDYRGHVSTTRTGKTCQSWASQSPHRHDYNKTGKFPDGSIVDAKNYCRNPRLKEQGLWCLTTDPNTRWESCDVLKCRTKDILRLSTIMRPAQRVHRSISLADIGLDDKWYHSIRHNDRYVGRAEMVVNGEWGTVCDNTLDKHDWPLLFCRRLGFIRAAEVRHVAPEERVGGRISSMSPQCDSAQYMSECNLQGTPCNHTRDVYVTCTNEGPGVAKDMIAIAEQLKRNVANIKKYGVPGNVVPWGWRTVPVIVGDEASVIMAVATFGRGKVVVFPHTAYLSTLKRLWKSAVPTPLYKNIRSWLQNGNRNVPIVGNPDKKKLKQNTVAAYTSVSEPMVDSVIEFVKNGGSVVISATTWAMHGYSPADSTPTQKVVWAFGISYSARYFKGMPRPIKKDEYTQYHLGAILDTLAEYPYKYRTYMGNAQYFLGGLGKESRKKLSHPIQLIFQSIAQRVSKISVKKFNSLDANLLKFIGFIIHTNDLPGYKAPWVDIFPGDYTAKPETTCVKLRFKSHQKDVHPTGYYVPAGSTLEVRVLRFSGSDLGDWQVRVGSHYDNLGHKESLNRWPLVYYKNKLKAYLQISTAFGGLVYFFSPETTVHLEVQLEGVVQSPYFDVNNPYSKQEWQERRNSLGIWGDLVGNYIILTVPSELLKTVSKPEKVLEFWDEVVLTQHNLRGTNPLKQRRMWIVPDIQPSYGYMHAGHPIVTHLDIVDPKRGNDLVNPARIKEKGQWGLYHELGHNMQRGVWTFGGTVEVTCNIFTLFCDETFTSGVDDPLAGRMKKFMNELKKYLKSAPTLKKWKKHAFVALGIYAQMAHHFGWGCYQTVFTRYESLPDVSKPKGDQQEIDKWISMFSLATGYDLRPLFAFWGISFSKGAKVFAKLSNLPGFLPRDQITNMVPERVAKINKQYPGLHFNATRTQCKFDAEMFHHEQCGQYPTLLSEVTCTPANSRSKRSLHKSNVTYTHILGNWQMKEDEDPDRSCGGVGTEDEDDEMEPAIL